MDLTNQTQESAQRALAIPEILRMIFDQKPRNEGTVTSRQSDLLKWALVNSRWFSEAIPVLWSRPQFPLDAIMGKVSPERRQFYANCVMWTRVLQFSSPSGKQKDYFAEKGPLNGLVFPKLVRIFASIYTPANSFCAVTHEEVYWTRIMYFERREATSDAEQNMDSVFRIISNLMPSLRHMALGYDKRMSHLEGMIESSGDDLTPASTDLHWFVRQDPREDAEVENDETGNNIQNNSGQNT